ncbi:RHS repeat-associated core domain protein [Hallella bergensis DSM 17361]|uniref:RHS repeat-associated core domain protein n=2 Tax=Hallella bergensis TaxID=242750 RepID=D1PW23_9BACT|nr:RHS repeat-associated core domain protein [Hallella bergensis DSM 17361]
MPLRNNRTYPHKIELRTYLKYCNGAETFYSYDPQRRRLQNLAVNAGGKTIMDNAYGYDVVSNVLSVVNKATIPEKGKAGGQMSHSYTYDALYRLSTANGTYKGADNKTASYTLAMGYDNMHRITSKKQHLTQSNVQFNGTLNAGYDLTYTYNNDEGKKFQLASVRDINYRTEEAPTDSTNINNGHKYTYDANGNLVYINTSRVKHDGKEDDKASEQKYKWDEENRLLAADENGFVSNYWYDADGERTAKTSGENEAIFVNSEFSGGSTGTARFSLYVSPYLVAGQGGKYTKHIYIGSQRIVSKLGDLASYGADPRRIPYAGNEADGVTVNYKDKYNQQLQSIKDNYKTFDLPYNGQDNPDYVNGKGFSSDDDTPEAAQARAMVKTRAGEAGTNERMQFYYHPDHLGSSSYITNLDGEVAQHIEYVPFGEVFIEERNNTWNTPYLFNAKELDEETGMYYYGARYYEPRLSLWMNCDPMEENLPSSSTYSYAANNPIRFIDMEGKIPFDKSVAHTRISSGFGIRKHPITGELKGHGGIDLATAGTGHDVHVLADGVVKKVGWNVKVDSKGNKTGYGRYVVVQYSDGYESLYAHLDKNGVAVSVGDKVSENDVIAKSGNTGGSTGPHLHIEISKGNILQKSNKIDPSSIPDLQLLLHPDNKEYYGGELSPVTVYGHAPTPMLLQPISLPKIEEIKINTQDKK